VDPLLIPFGFGVGFLVGVTGMGGGSLMTPLLILIFGYSPVTAVGSDISYAAVTKTVGGWRHIRLGTVHKSLSFWMASGSVPAAIAGVWVIEWLHNRYGASLDEIVLTMLAVALVAVGTLILVRALFMANAVAAEREAFELTRNQKTAAVLIGATTGFVIGLTSAGSGTLIAVFLIAYYRMVPRTVVGTDVFHAAILLWAAAIAHIVAGNVDFALVGAILIGSIPGVWLGSHLTVKLPSAVLRTALGVVMIAAALALFEKAGVAIPVAVRIAIPIAFLAALGAQFLLRSRRAGAAAAPASPAPAQPAPAPSSAPASAPSPAPSPAPATPAPGTPGTSPR
jgi:hypothetical protein